MKGRTQPGAGRGRETLALLAVMLVAVAARAWHVGWGLPDFTEEAIPLHLSFSMRSLESGAIDWNPHAFHYPSLGIYLHLLVQQGLFMIGRLMGLWASAPDYQLAFDLEPARMVLAARALGIACDALSVLAAWRIGACVAPRFAWGGAVAIAISATFITTSRSIYVDSIAVCLALWSLERMLAWSALGGRARLVSAAVAVGAAAGAKYPAAIMLLPLATLALQRQGSLGARARDVLLASALAAFTFVLTTPFAVLDSHAFLRDFGFEGMHASEGHFGSVGHRSFAFHGANLVRDLGWPAVLLACAAPLLAWTDSARRATTLAVLAMLLGFGVPISLARIDAERYLLPVIAAVGLLASLGADSLVQRAPAARRIAVLGMLALVLGIVPLNSGARATIQGGRDTQVEARLWCEQHMTRDQLVITEGYGPRLADVARIDELRAAPEYRLASEVWRARLDRRPGLRVVAVPLPVSGRLETSLRGADGTTQFVLVAPHASAIARAYYEPALYSAADWFITTSAVRGRYEADSERFRVQCEFYRHLEQHAEIVARFEPGAGTTGPEIVIHRLGAPARAAFAAGGTLDPLWWLASIPANYRSRAMPSAGTPADPKLEPWVQSLTPLYLVRFAEFMSDLADALAALGRWQAAVPVALANHRMLPGDVPSAILASFCLLRTERWSEARAVLERTRAMLPAGPPDPSLELLYARSLAHTGQPARAQAVYAALEQALPVGHPAVEVARAERERLAAAGGRAGGH